MAKRKSSDRDKALQEFQRNRRLENSNDNGWTTCISCGRPVRVDRCDGGHYIGRTNRATELEPDNCWPQCKQCNGMKQGNAFAYRINLVKRIGLARVERIENMGLFGQGNDDALAKLSEEDQRNLTAKRSKTYYAEIAKNYREKNKKLLREKVV